IPIFFIQDAIKFPDLIHSVKPEPDREIPQAQSAHDTFWDFASLQPESTHMLMWVMSDRAIPRSYRTMEGFGIHTFRLVNAKGKTSLVKFHWKPAAGKHSLVWEESQKLGGIDPDFHRRDLWDAIEAGAGPEYELGLQVMPDSDDQTFEGIDLLDPTKIVPEELCPVQIVGRMVLDTNPTNFFAETEQVAFHPGHLVPGIGATDDPLFQGRLFSYLDTQLTRLGGPNFSQIPVNRPVADVNDNHRDGFGQQAVHEGKAAYFPNSTGGGCPFLSTATEGGYVHFPKEVSGLKVAERAVSFKDFYTQATLFWNSMSRPEKDHMVGAFSFELSKVEVEEIRERMLGNLANVAAELTERVAANLGMPAPKGKPATDAGESPALSMIPKAPGPINGRVIGIMAGDGVDGAGLKALDKAFTAAGARLMVIAPHGGTVTSSTAGEPFPVAKTAFNSQSVEFDAVILAGGSDLGAIAADPRAKSFFGEADLHCKTIAAWGNAVEVLSGFGVAVDAPGVVTADKPAKAFAESVVEAVGWHRHWDRAHPAG
ncbi:MAG: catalase, partial [Actinomycetota bacterium]